MHFHQTDFIISTRKGEQFVSITELKLSHKKAETFHSILKASAGYIFSLILWPPTFHTLMSVR